MGLFGCSILAILVDKGGPGHLGGEIGSNIQLPDKAPLFTQLAVWVDPGKSTTWLYAATTKNLVAYQLQLDSVNMPVLNLAWQIPVGSESSPIVVGNMIFYAHSQEIMALDPLTGQQLWHSTQLGDIHWQSPIAINGILYMTDQQNKLTAYSLK